MDETLWIPQHPDSSEYGEEPCKLCGGNGDLRILRGRWKDTRKTETAKLEGIWIDLYMAEISNLQKAKELCKMLNVTFIPVLCPVDSTNIIVV